MRYLLNVDPRIRAQVKNPVTVRVTDFNEDSIAKYASLINKAHNTGQDILPLIIDSYGGQVYSLLALLAEIDNCKMPVATICMGKAMSCGTILLACGTPGQRFIDTNATVMIHEVSSGDCGKNVDLKASTANTDRLNTLILRRMAKACGHKDQDYFVKLIDQNKHADLFLTAQEAKRHKIVDHIRIPNLEVTVSMTMKFT